MHSVKRTLLAAALCVSGAALATEADIRKAVRSVAGDVTVREIKPAPVGGLFEVVLDGARGPQIVFATPKGEFLFVGDLLDVAKKTNYTEDRTEALMRVPFDSLPLEKAIKIVKGDGGNGTRKLAVFSDPDCPFCRKLEHEIKKIDNLTLYIFLLPIAHPDAVPKSKAIWCAKDRAKAWNDYMFKGELPKGAADCKTPVDATMDYGAKLRISGTPTLIFADGRRVDGYIPAARIEELLK